MLLICCRDKSCRKQDYSRDEYTMTPTYHKLFILCHSDPGLQRKAIAPKVAEFMILMYYQCIMQETIQLLK